MTAMHALSLLLLLLMVVTTQGIRLEEESAGAFQKKLKVEQESLPQGGEKPTVVKRAVVLCKQSGHCSGSKTRKLINNKEGPSVPPAPPTEIKIEPQKAEKYPDLLDLGGMDYSPAKRKTPIHN